MAGADANAGFVQNRRQIVRMNQFNLPIYAQSAAARNADAHTLLLAVNRATTGSFLVFGYDILNGPEHRPGFHASPLGFEHTRLVGRDLTLAR